MYSMKRRELRRVINQLGWDQRETAKQIAEDVRRMQPTSGTDRAERLRALGDAD